MNEKVINNYCNTVIIIDGDNLELSLERIYLKLSNLQSFINTFLEKNDSLIGMENREGVSFSPIVYIVSKMTSKNKIEEVIKIL